MRSLLIITCAVLTLPLVACNNRTTPPVPIQFERENADTADAGEDVDMTTPPMPDGICDDLDDGVSCSLEHGTGVCVRQRCRLVACLTGFDDCDDAPGCETDIRTVEDCGACGKACDDDRTCAVGPDGFVCTVGIVCPIDRFDLDSDPSNGCEWQAEWEAPYTIVPADMTIDEVSWSAGAPALLGHREGTRVSTRLGQTPEPTIWDTLAGVTPGLAVDYGDEWIRAVWADGVSVIRTEDNARQFAAPECDDTIAPRDIVAVDGEYVATAFEVFRFAVGDECSGTLACLLPVYDWATYLRDSYPHGEVFPRYPFGPGEVTACDGCLFDPTGDPVVPAECAGTRQCRPPDFDTASCGGCSAAGCPTFDVVDLFESEEILFVVTARGFVALHKADFSMVLRAEAPFDPDTAGGARYVGAVEPTIADPSAVTLLHAAGYATGARVDRTDTPIVTPTHPPVGLGVDPQQGSVAATPGLLVTVSGDEVRLMNPTSRSARQAFATLESAPGVQGLQPIAALTTEDGIRVFYTATGQLFGRLFTPVDEEEQ